MVKFRAYKIKAKVYDCRFNLSNKYMTGDFTVSNHKIIDKLLQLQWEKKLKSSGHTIPSQSVESYVLAVLMK